MAEIRPFRGVRYNQQKNSDVSKLICPPYDIISAWQQDDLYRRSEYNFVRIEYNRELPGDTGQDNRYTRAAALLSQWLDTGILQRETLPALYVHEHHFCLAGKGIKRQNIISLVRLEEWERMIVRPHENIIPRAKSDRMSMLKTCQANTSPVLGMYVDPENKIMDLLSLSMDKAPVIDAAGEDGEYHKLWVMDRPEIISRVRQEFSQQPLYIADGHHRYDSALTFMKEDQAREGRVDREAGNCFVMMSLVSMSDPGMVILPSHRLVKGIPGHTLAGLKNELKKFFEIEELSLDNTGTDTKLDSLLCGIGPETQTVRLAVYGLDKDKIQVLTLRDFESTTRLMPSGHGEMYRKMDVSLVDHIILEKLLAYQKDKGEIIIDYCDDRQESMDRVKEGMFQLVFILNPVRPELIKEIADTGDRMPRKSTYFYPKAPAGVVFYKW